MARVRTVSVRVTAEISDLEKKLRSAQKSLRSAGKQMQDVGGTMTQGLTLPIVALGAAAFASAEDLDKAYGQIRAGTGATGKDLEGLKESFKTVFADVPQSADEVAQALADVNTRTGATGKHLEALTKQFLDLGDMAGEDVPTLIANGTRVFGDWGIAVDDQTKTMDYFFKVSQSTGIGVTELMDKVVQFGAPLRQMGFDFETSAALLGKFEKEGVNSELVMGSMRIALGKMAKEGIGAEEGLKKTIDAVKNAGSTSEANALAMELFGAKAGPDMAAAIREGRFEVDELMATLSASGETIAKADEDTATFGETLAQFKNQSQVALEPLGLILIKLAEEWLPKVIGALEKAANWFNNLSPEMQKVTVIIGLVVAAIGPLLILLGTLSIAIGAISLPVVLVVAGIAALIAIGVLLYKNWDEISAFAVSIWGSISDFFSGLWTTITDAMTTAWNAVSDFLSGLWDGIKKLASDAFGGIASTLDGIWKGVTGTVKSVWDGIISTIKGAINFIIGAINTFINGINNIKISVPAIDIPLIGKVGGFSIGLPDIPNIPQLATGTNNVPKDMLALLHKGEAVVPKKFNNNGNAGGGTLNHTGTIRVEGVNDRGQLVGVTEIVAREILTNQDRFAQTPSSRRVFR